MITSNIDSVIDSVDDMKTGLRYEMRKRIGRAMSMCEQRAKVYVQRDSDYTGKLHQSIHKEEEYDNEQIQFKVATDGDIAPYAAIVEYGSGKRGKAGEEWEGSANAPPEAPSSSKPPRWPFESPDISYNKNNPYDLSGHGDFAGFVNHIQQWMRKKPVEPESGDLFTSAVGIARSIIEKGNFAHPFMRPAWFDTELRVKKAATNALRNATR